MNYIRGTMKYIRNILVPTLLFTLLTPLAFSQADSSDYEASMEGWEVDLNVAMEESQRTGKPIMANFTGTDWCGWCMRLKAAVFTTDEFKKWADDNVVLLELDFPKRFQLPANIAEQNAGLAQAFGVSGYPTIWVFDISMNEDTGETSVQALAKTGYGPEPKAWIQDVETKMEAARASLNRVDSDTNSDSGTGSGE